VLLTRGAQQVDDTHRWDTEQQQVQSAVWGLARTLRTEQRQLRCVCVDLPMIDTPVTTEAFGCVHLNMIDSDEEEIVIRDDGTYVRRLVECSAELQALPQAKFASDGAYIISGGLGGLGLVAARHLLLNGAESVVLLTRSGVVAYDSSDMWDEVCQYGASKVTVMRCDVGDSVAVSRMIAEVRSLHGRVCGVLHAAGTLEDKLLTNQSVSNFTRVCDPKMNGAWNLHSATLADPLSCFVMYSSITAVFGGAGQSNYGFANAWLDSLASSRQQMGLSAVSAQWGAWAGAGMAVRSGTLSRLGYLGLVELPMDVGVKQ